MSKEKLNVFFALTLCTTFILIDIFFIKNNIDNIFTEVRIGISPSSDSLDEMAVWTPDTGWVVNPEYADELAEWQANDQGWVSDYFVVNGHEPSGSQQSANPPAAIEVPSAETEKPGKTPADEVDQVNCEHDFVFTIRIEPTCTEYGSVCYECSKCQLPKTDAIEPGHKFKVVEDKAATCTEDGYKKSVCEVCEEELIENKVEATGHTEVVEEVPATLFKDGSYVVTCSTCGAMLVNEIIPRIMPTWSVVVCSVLLVGIIVVLVLILKKKNK